MASFCYDASSHTYYYVIGVSGDQSKSIAVRTVDRMTDLLKLTSKNGIVVVTQAYLDDPTVDEGWAAYRYDSKELTWVKFQEEESMDVVIPEVDLSAYATIEYVDTKNLIFVNALNALTSRVSTIETYLRNCDGALQTLD